MKTYLGYETLENSGFFLPSSQGYLKGTCREKAPSNKTAVLSRNMNIDIWIVGTSIQFFIRSS